MRFFKTVKKAIMAAGVVLIPTAAFAGNAAVPVSEIPTLGQWGMIGAAVVLGAAGLYTIFKK